MPKYVLGHHLKGEGVRLDLMSELLDPMHRRYIDALGVVRPGARTLEVGCGNGSISAWLAGTSKPWRNGGSCRSGFIAGSGPHAES